MANLGSPDPLESLMDDERVLPRNIINLASVSISHVEHEAVKKTSDMVKPELSVERSHVDTKPTKLKHYDPRNLNVNTFCNIFLEGGVCLAGEENEQNKYSYQHDLIGFFDFDQEINVDLSGSKVALNEAIKAGPGVNEKGASAFFNGDNFVTVNHYPAWKTPEMRISFWIYIIASTSDKDGMYCPLILKGYDDYKNHHFNRYPGIFIQETTRKIRAFVSLANRDKYRDGIWTESIGRVPLQRWTHVSFAFNKQKMELYLNGILDSYQTLDGRELEDNTDKLYIGGHPSYLQGCKMAYYIDNLKVFNKVSTQFTVEAEAFGALGTVAPSQIMIGCINCDFVDAKNSCIPSYHLCTNAEMYSGVFQAVRIMGWVQNWLTQNTAPKRPLIVDSPIARSQNKTGLAVCCRDRLK